MKKVFYVVLLPICFMVFVGCSNSSDQSGQTPNSSTTTNNKDENHTVSSDSSSKDNNDTSDEETDSNSDNASSEDNEINADDQADKDTQSQYSSEQIEYARVWLELGPNQELDELNVRHIPAGTPLNPNDDTSANYPEDVIQLAGSRLVDGSVTYSGNGDGTINVYNVPLRWDGQYPAGKDFYTDIIENTKLVYIDPGADEEVSKLIQLLRVHN